MNKITDYVVIDTETTGFSPETCKIIEICVSRVRNGQIVETFSTLINPGCQLPYYIPDITGITDEMLGGKPSFCDIADKLKDFIGTDIIIGHNIRFDIGFLNAAYGEEIENKTLDTIQVAKKLKPDLESYRLEYLCKTFGIADKQHHRAQSDVYLTHKLYEFLTKDK